MAKDKLNFEDATWVVALETAARFRDGGLLWDQANETWLLNGQPTDLGVPDWVYFSRTIRARTGCRFRAKEPNCIWHQCQTPSGMKKIAENTKLFLAVGRHDVATLKRENRQLKRQLTMVNSEKRSLLKALEKLLHKPDMDTL